MTETFIEMTEDEFEKRFELVTNHIDPSAGWAYGDSNGCLFETYGEEFAFVKQADPRQVWTLTVSVHDLGGAFFDFGVSLLLASQRLADA